MIDIKIPPAPPLPPGAALPSPSDEDLESYFTRVGEEVAKHPALAWTHMLLGGLSAFLDGHKAMLELLLRAGVLLPEHAEAFDPIRQEIAARDNQQGMRSFVAMTAQGLVRVNGSPLTPDEVSSFLTAFFEPTPERIGVALSMIVRRACPPERVASLWASTKDAESPLKAMFDYEKANGPDAALESRIKALEAEVAELKKARDGRVT